jgi:hypothetical protein
VEPGQQWALDNPEAAQLPKDNSGIHSAGSGSVVQGDPGSRNEVTRGGPSRNPDAVFARSARAVSRLLNGTGSSSGGSGPGDASGGLRGDPVNATGQPAANLGSGTGLSGSAERVSRVTTHGATLASRALGALKKMPNTFTLNRISLMSVVVVIAIVVGGLVVLTNPHDLSFADYWKYVVIGGGLTGIGRGLDSGTGTAP